MTRPSTASRLQCAGAPPSSPACTAGKCVVTGPGQGLDAGTPFPCGTAGLNCNPATQYCSITEGGAIQPDGGVAYHAGCETIPAQCANNRPVAANVCGCLQSVTSGQCTSDGAGDLTVTIAVP